MLDGKCSKHYPKKFQRYTKVDENGFPVYRRRETSHIKLHNGVELDNRFIVPHNVDLLVKYQSHLNVEVCSRSRAIKYLFKYINKSADRTRAVLE